MDDPVIDGETIRNLCEARGMTMSELAQSAGIDHAVVSRLERALQRDLTVSALVGLARALGVAVDTLLVAAQGAGDGGEGVIGELRAGGWRAIVVVSLTSRREHAHGTRSPEAPGAHRGHWRRPHGRPRRRSRPCLPPAREPRRRHPARPGRRRAHAAGHDRGRRQQLPALRRAGPPARGRRASRLRARGRALRGGQLPHHRRRARGHPHRAARHRGRRRRGRRHRPDLRGAHQPRAPRGRCPGLRALRVHTGRGVAARPRGVARGGRPRHTGHAADVALDAVGWSLLLRVSDYGIDGATMAERLFAEGVCATGMAGWGVRHGAAYIRFVFSNEPVERLAGVGVRVRSALRIG